VHVLCHLKQKMVFYVYRLETFLYWLFVDMDGVWFEYCKIYAMMGGDNKDLTMYFHGINPKIR
jgi:hypothetical protein